jgi:hypothetical protein
MDRTALFQLTARLRRAFPRQGDVLSVCDEAERLATTIGSREPKRDRAAYMRAWRSRQKKSSGTQ